MILQNVRKLCNNLLQTETKSNILNLFVAECELLSFQNRTSVLRVTMQMSLVNKNSVPGIQIIQIRTSHQEVGGYDLMVNGEV